MGAPVTLPGPVRAIPRYLNPDLTLNRGAILQAATAEARARFATAGQPRSYSVGRKLWPMRVRSFAEIHSEALARVTDIAEGMRASELHVQALDRA